MEVGMLIKSPYFGGQGSVIEICCSINALCFQVKLEAIVAGSGR